MLQLKAISRTSSVNDWLSISRQPRVLHVFDRACNLINENREVLSIVTPEIGNGPFNLVVESDILFNEHLSSEAPISNSANQLNAGDLAIRVADAMLWNPRPDWEVLYSKRNTISKQLTRSPVIKYPASIHATSTHLLSDLSSALVNPDISTAKEITSKLAGLGAGLTPAGDDFIVGALHAAWIVHPLEVAMDLGSTIADAAAGLTTSLSAAWIRSAGKGEAGELWHRLFEAICAGDESGIRSAIEQILSVGETSGADALNGFLGVFAAFESP